MKDGHTEKGILWWPNGQKKAEVSLERKDGKESGTRTVWYPSGEKGGEETIKDGKVFSEKFWDKEGNEITEAAARGIMEAVTREQEAADFANKALEALESFVEEPCSS